MASTVNIPLIGPANKGKVVGVTIGGFAVAGYLIYKRAKKNQQQAAAVKAASGYGYGTGAYGYGTSGGSGAGAFYGYGEPGITYGYGASGGFEPTGYYGYGTPSPLPVANTTNAQWDQAAINQLTDEGYNPEAVSAALGAYLLGRNVDASQVNIIQSAIGLEGDPPQSGPGNFPPGIRTGGTPGGGTGGGQGGGERDYVQAPGNKTLGQIGAEHGDSQTRIYRLNPSLTHYAKRDLPKGTRVRIG